MPYRDPEKQKKAQRSHYLRNSERYKKKGVNWKHVHNPDTNRKQYDDVPRLAPNVHQLILRAGWETTTSIALRYDKPESTVRNACTRGDIPFFKIGNIRIIEPEDVDNYLKGVKPPNQRKAKPVVGRKPPERKPTNQRISVKAALSTISEAVEEVSTLRSRVAELEEVLKDIKDGKYSIPGILVQIERVLENERD